MKKIILGMLLCLMMPCLVMADGIKTFNFPKEKGVRMYGATMKDELGPLHYVMFHSNDSKVTKLGPIDENDNGTHMRNLRCGTFCGDKYYGYLVNVYSYTEEPKSYGTVDFSTGKFTTIRTDYDKTERLSWPIMYEMTYDNTNKICYGLGRNLDGLFVSDLYKIDITTGEYEMLATLDFYAWAMACDYEGNIYMIKGIPDKKNEFYAASSIVRIDHNDNYAVKDEKRITVGGKDFIPNYTHTMEFDHDTNRLYWLGMSNDGWQKVFDLDVKTGTAVETANMLYNMVSGLYIPFNGADNRMAAGMVTSLKGTPAADGSMKATLEWVNPTQNWKGDALEALKSVTIAKETRSNVIATIDAANGMGKSMAYTDENAQKGYNVYYITTNRIDEEKGLTDSVRVFVGADTPGRPQNINVTAEGKNVHIDWQAPATGAHGEKYDLSTTVYEITRMPDSIVIVSGLAATTFTDDKIGSKKHYSYIIKASNAEGEGLSEQSASINIGSAHTLPFAEKFDTELCKDMWTSVDANNDGITFEWAGGVVKDFYRYQIWLNNQFDTNDFMITPPLATKVGSTYRINYDIQLGRMEDIHKFAITTGNAPTAEAMTNIVDTKDNVKCESYNQIMSYENKFKADADETYVGINCLSYKSETGSYFAVRNFRIEEIFANDLTATGITGSREMTTNQPSDLTVTIKNTGSETQNSYKVEIITKDAEGNIVVIGSTDVNEALAADDTKDVTVSAVPSTEGEIEIAARVTLDGDMNNANNISSWYTYKVNPAGTSEWNVLVEGENTGVSTTEPMNFYNVYSTVETIYLKDEIKAEKDGKITRIAYQYSDNSLAGETEPCDVKIYMANTDREGYDSNANAKDWTPLDKSTLVCEKTITIVPGTDNLLVFDLDTPFEYDHTKNLSIQVWKEGSLEEMFPAMFKTYDFGYEVYRSLRYNTNRYAFDFTDSKYFFSVNNVPVVHMAVDFDDHSGIFEINGSNGIIYEDGMLSIQNGILTDIKVVDVTGKMIMNEKVNAPSIRLDLQNGMYIVKVCDNEGKSHVIKVIGE